MRRAALIAAVAALLACGPKTGASRGAGAPAGSRADVAVIADGPIEPAPAVAALGETLPPGSAVAVIAGGRVTRPLSSPSATSAPSSPAAPSGQLAASIDRALALLSESKAPVRAVIVASDGAAPPPEPLAARITRMRRAGILGYLILVDASGSPAIEAVGYTLTRRVSSDKLGATAGAIGAAIGSR